MGKALIGVDIGGTTVKIGFFSLEGEMIDKYEITTNKENKGKQIIPDIARSIKDKAESLAIEKQSLIGIGVGAPGFIIGELGLVEEGVNIGWKNVNVSKELQQLTGLSVFLENDANVAALGENWKGSGNQARNFVAITLGTGVGGGIIANGQLLSGVNGTAGEIGHITVDPNGYPCNCGRNGCLETIVSATGIARQAMEIVAAKPDSNLANHFQTFGVIHAKDVFDLAGTDDQDCLQIVSRTGDVLGLSLANIATMINPSKIVIGGGVSKAGKPLLDAIQLAFNRYALDRLTRVCDIDTAQLGNDAGIYGAAFLVKSNFK